MIFCIDNKTPTTPTSEVGNLTNYPFSNATTDTLQDKYFCTSVIISADSDGNSISKTRHPKIVLFGLDCAADVSVLFYTPAVYSDLVTITAAEIAANGYAVIDNTYLGSQLSISSTSEISFGHLYMGSPYELPDPVFGSVPNYDDNDFISDGQSGKQFVTDGHTWREQGFSVVEATEASYDTFVSFITGANRKKPFVFFQTEDNLSLFPPYFARLDGKPEFGGRNIRKKFRWEFKIREVF